MLIYQTILRDSVSHKTVAEETGVRVQFETKRRESFPDPTRAQSVPKLPQMSPVFSLTQPGHTRAQAFAGEALGVGCRRHKVPRVSGWDANVAYEKRRYVTSRDKNRLA